MKLFFILLLFLLSNINEKAEEQLNMNSDVNYVACKKLLLSYGQAQDTSNTKNPLIKKWMIEQIIVNGKKEEPSDFEIEFSSDGTYYLIEDDEPEEGTWELDDEVMSIIFNRGTDEEFVWEIVTLEEKKLLVKETYGKTVAIYLLVPWIDWRELIGE
jgi:hypothetical protein